MSKMKQLLNVLQKHDISFDQFMILYLIDEKDELVSFVNNLTESYTLLQNLHRRGFIKFMSEDMDNYSRVDYIMLGSKGHDCMDDYYDEINELDEEIAKEHRNDDWVEEYRNIFAPAKSSSGRPIKGGKAACYKKMERFLREHPDIEPKEILRAAQNYITRKAKDNYTYVTCADYFIYKRDKTGAEVSLLETEVEMVKEGHIEKSGDEFVTKL